MARDDPYWVALGLPSGLWPFSNLGVEDISDFFGKSRPRCPKCAHGLFAGMRNSREGGVSLLADAWLETLNNDDLEQPTPF